MNKVVLVTGASRGIGATIALKFASKGDNVILNYFNSKDEVDELNRMILEKYNVKTLIIKADVSNEQSVKNMIEQVVNIFGHIDVLVCNAGIAYDSLIEDKTVDNFNQILNVNLIGPFICARECAKVMPEGSSIINISSTNGIDTYYPYSLDYDASKAGLISLTHNLAVAYSPKIRVNSVAPGWVNTEMNKELDKDYIAEECKKILLGRFANPSEIANVVYFLASEEASYINGTTVRVDGGK